MKVFLALICVIFCVSQAVAQDLSGRITDAEGTPIPGAHVIPLGTNMGAVSDANGRYSITNIETGVYEIQVS